MGGSDWKALTHETLAELEEVGAMLDAYDERILKLSQAIARGEPVDAQKIIEQFALSNGMHSRLNSAMRKVQEIQIIGIQAFYDRKLKRREEDNGED